MRHYPLRIFLPGVFFQDRLLLGGLAGIDFTNHFLV
jgi:hypothetical protein